MRHRNSGRKLGRNSSHRAALFNNLVTSLLTYGRIETTEAKAKELRRFADATITWGISVARARRQGRQGARPSERAKIVHARRMARQTVKTRDALDRLFAEIGPHFASRKGGYTRILKTRVRKGDAAPMAFVELVGLNGQPHGVSLRAAQRSSYGRCCHRASLRDENFTMLCDARRMAGFRFSAIQARSESMYRRPGFTRETSAMRITTFFALSTLALFACRSDSNNTTDGNGGGDGSGSNAGAVKIQDVQNDAMAPGTAVELHGVIVTAIDNYGAKAGDFWVEDADGGPFSGIHVFGAATSDVAAPRARRHRRHLRRGQVRVRADLRHHRPHGHRARARRRAADHDHQDRLRRGSGPAGGRRPRDRPARRDLAALRHLAALDGVGEVGRRPDHGAERVRAQRPEVRRLRRARIRRSRTFGVTGDAMVESSLAAFPNDGGTPPHDLIARGDCLGGVTGVVDYFFDYLILPRQTAEVMTGRHRAGPPAARSGSRAVSVAMEPITMGTASSIATISVVRLVPAPTLRVLRRPRSSTSQNGTHATGAVRFDNGVYVTARKADGHTLWVADALAGAQYNGVEVFFGSSVVADAAFWFPGAKIDLRASCRSSTSAS